MFLFILRAQSVQASCTFSYVCAHSHAVTNVHTLMKTHRFPYGFLMDFQIDMQMDFLMNFRMNFQMDMQIFEQILERILEWI